jgi:hypothetical protein
MKRHLIHLAGLTLAATIWTLPAMAQQPSFDRQPLFAAAPPATPPPSAGLNRAEIEVSDDAFAAARAGVADAATTVRRIFADGESPDRPLIISSSAPDEKAIATLDEDLNIMARILDKSIDRGGDDDRKGPMGIHLWALGQGGNRGARNLYLEGYGAVFILNVNMPLLAPPAKPQVEDKKEQTSSTWEEARNELYGHEDRGEFKRFGGDKRPGQPYDAERVEELKKDLSEALKNATHIRGLKDNEHVTIVVQGSGSDHTIRRARTAGPKKGEVSEDVFAFAFAPGGGARSVMTLRAKKSDIDAFAKGKIELDDFRKKVSTAVYQIPGGGAAAAATGGEMRLRRP